MVKLGQEELEVRLQNRAKLRMFIDEMGFTRRQAAAALGITLGGLGKCLDGDIPVNPVGKQTLYLIDYIIDRGIPLHEIPPWRPRGHLPGYRAGTVRGPYRRKPRNKMAA